MRMTFSVSSMLRRSRSIPRSAAASMLRRRLRVGSRGDGLPEPSAGPLDDRGPAGGDHRTRQRDAASDPTGFLGAARAQSRALESRMGAGLSATPMEIADALADALIQVSPEQNIQVHGRMLFSPTPPAFDIYPANPA